MSPIQFGIGPLSELSAISLRFQSSVKVELHRPTDKNCSHIGKIFQLADGFGDLSLQAILRQVSARWSKNHAESNQTKEIQSSIQ
jgi:hypothetical protein